nr:hypothetical protein [Tanacetum cinerariifolium]
DAYEAIRQACLVETDTESKPFEDPIDTKTPESPHTVASPTPLPDSTPLACHANELEDSNTSSVRSMSSDSTTPLSPDHPLTRTLPTPTPTRALFHYRTAPFRRRYRSSYETPSSSSCLTLPVKKRYRGTFELILDTDSEEDEIGEEDTNEDEGHGLDDESHRLDDENHRLDEKGHSLDGEDCSVESDGLGLEGEEEVVPEAPAIETTMGEPLGLGYKALRSQELAVEEAQVYSTFEVGQGSRSVPGPKRPERLSALRHHTLTTWINIEDDIAYIDVPAYPLPAQTPPSPEWSSGSPPVSPAPSAAWAWHVDTRMENMSRAGYDDDRLIHNMLVQQAALQHELQEMIGRVTALEQERDRRER